ncbi:MAG: hypothetical protein QM656_06045 [Paracoccaceae bacterium]
MEKTAIRRLQIGLAVVLGLAGVFVWYMARYHGQVALAGIAAVFLGILTPLGIITIRHQVRLHRIRLIDLFAENFDLIENDGQNRQKVYLTSFEFVRGKYFADLNIATDRPPTLADVPRFPMMVHSDWMLLVCAIPYMVLVSFGMIMVFAPVSALTGAGGGLAQFLSPSLLTSGGMVTDLAAGCKSGTGVICLSDLPRIHENILTVVSITFAGGYFFTLRLFLRSVAVFDLSPLSFLRAFAHIILAMLITVIFYRLAVSSSVGTYVENLAGKDWNASKPVSGEIMVLAFVTGFFADIGLNYLLGFSRLSMKRRNGDLDAHTRTVPLTLLDGIDPTIAFRLEEANIHDVQNLATFNPIMLHIESPFGIYQTMDWVAQAQLCTTVGPERFLALRAINIRTVLDLGEAVLRSDADVEILKLAGRILLQETASQKKAHTELSLGEPKLSGEVTEANIRHLVRVMVDDLHVHRLVSLWLLIRAKIWKDNEASKDRAAFIPDHWAVLYFWERRSRDAGQINGAALPTPEAPQAGANPVQ